MRPERDETYHRLVLRAVGTVLGLVVATALAETFGDDDLVVAIVLTVAAALTFGLLTVQYALFTAAITTYVVAPHRHPRRARLPRRRPAGLRHRAGDPDRLLAFVVWPNPGEGRGRRNRRSGPAGGRRPVDLASQPNCRRRRGRPQEQTLSNRTFVIGVGMTKFEKPGTKEGDYPDWAKEAGEKALADAGIPYDDVEQAYAGYCYGDSTYGQRALYQLGLTGIPVVNVNNNCSTGSSALFLARQAVKGGLVDCAMAIGFEKMEPRQPRG